MQLIHSCGKMMFGKVIHKLEWLKLTKITAILLSAITVIEATPSCIVILYYRKKQIVIIGPSLSIEALRITGQWAFWTGSMALTRDSAAARYTRGITSSWD